MEALELAKQFQQNLPDRIRDYLCNERGISNAVIDLAILGWDGRRITIPIFDRNHRFAFFKLAKDPEDKGDSPKMLAPAGSHAELCGWERVLVRPEQIIICEGEFDRLLLETHGFAAVTSTGGATTFPREWAEDFKEIPNVYLCFDRDAAGEAGVRHVASLIPHVRIIRLPDGVGEGGDVTDFFVRLEGTEDDFRHLLEVAQPLRPEGTVTPTRRSFSGSSEIAELKARVRIEDLIGRHLELNPNGPKLVARCPFHEDRRPSFVVYPETQTFHCFGCREHGDVLTFLMRKENLTFPEALNVLRAIAR